MDELKPVPCGCGGEAHVMQPSYTHCHVVMCPKCGIKTAFMNTEAEAVTAWNRAMGERTAKLDHTYQVGENWYCENCGQQLNAYDWETPQNFAELGNGNAQVSEVTSQNDEGTWQKTERTAKVKGRWQRRKGSDCWECSECHAVLENDDLGMHNFYFCYHCGANMMNKSGYMDIEEVHYE